jgi:hypothetical protein
MSPIIEVLIGMVFIYSLLSILVTQLNTVIANTLNLRAKHLRDGISELVKDKTILAKVMTHPLVDMVENKLGLPEEQLNEEQISAIVTGTLKSVTWIAPENFTNVLLNIIRIHSDKELYAALLNTIDGMPAGEQRRRLRVLVNQITNTGQGAEQLREYVNKLEDASYRHALNEILKQIDDEIIELGIDPTSNVTILAGLRKVKNPYLRNALSTILSTSKTVEEAEQKIGQWFDNGMSRATTAFQNTMQYWSLAIGILLALVLNIDTIDIARTLWEDEGFRYTLNSTIQATDITQLQQISQEAAPTDIVAQSVEDDTGMEMAGVNALETYRHISDLRLPIGWNFQPLNPAEDEDFVGNPRYTWNFIPGNYDGWFVLWVTKIIGLGATMVAIAQGAPFWFGILRRLSGGSNA